MLGIKKNGQVNEQRPFSWMENYSRRQQFRRMALSLLAQKDDVLSDLGYERRHVSSALNLPISSDAVKYLEQHRRI